MLVLKLGVLFHHISLVYVQSWPILSGTDTEDTPPLPQAMLIATEIIGTVDIHSNMRTLHAGGEVFRVEFWNFVPTFLARIVVFLPSGNECTRFYCKNSDLFLPHICSTILHHFVFSR